MLKTLGVICLSAIPVYIGFCESRTIGDRLSDIEGYLLLVRRMEELVCFSQLPFGAMMEKICREEGGRYRVIRILGDHLEKNLAPLDLWRACEEPDASLTPVLTDFFASCGKTPVDGQAQLCRTTITRLETIYEERKKSSENKRRICRTVGILGGAFLAIILL